MRIASFFHFMRIVFFQKLCYTRKNGIWPKERRLGTPEKAFFRLELPSIERSESGHPPPKIGVWITLFRLDVME